VGVSEAVAVFRGVAEGLGLAVTVKVGEWVGLGPKVMV
jgi:hypothetical protein